MSDESVKTVRSYSQLPPLSQTMSSLDFKAIPNRWYAFLKGEDVKQQEMDYILSAHLLHRIALWYFPIELENGSWEYRDSPLLTNYQYYQYAFCAGYKPIAKAFQILEERGLISIMEAGMIKNKQHYWVHLNLSKLQEITEKTQTNWRKVKKKSNSKFKKSTSYLSTAKSELKKTSKKPSINTETKEEVHSEVEVKPMVEIKPIVEVVVENQTETPPKTTKTKVGSTTETKTKKIVKVKKK